MSFEIVDNIPQQNGRGRLGRFTSALRELTDLLMQCSIEQAVKVPIAAITSSKKNARTCLHNRMKINGIKISTHVEGDFIYVQRKQG